METDIPYGKEKIRLKIDIPFEILLPNKIDIKSEGDLIEKAFMNPIGKESFDEFASNAKRLLVIVDDATRPTPTSKILDYVYPVLSSHPDVKFLIATGTHRNPTDEEYKYIFGKYYDVFKDRIYVNNSRKNEDMIYLGNTKYGTEVHINKMVIDAGNVLVIGNVKPHYFAGYSGGRKSFLPGVASYKTIEMNHKHALSDKARSIALEENPVNEDMVEAVSFLNDINIFSVQFVLTDKHEIYAITAGDLYKSFNEAVKYADDVFCVPLKQKGNIVLTVAPYPMDIDLYQSQAAMDNGKFALEDNGVLILVSKCRKGVGLDTFLDLLDRADTPHEIFEILADEYILGYHKIAKMIKIKMKSEIWGVSDLNDSTMKRARIKPFSDVQSAFDEAVKVVQSKGLKPRAVIMPAGSLTVPQF